MKKYYGMHINKGISFEGTNNLNKDHKVLQSVNFNLGILPKVIIFNRAG